MFRQHRAPHHVQGDQAAQRDGHKPEQTHQQKPATIRGSRCGDGLALTLLLQIHERRKMADHHSLYGGHLVEQKTPGFGDIPLLQQFRHPCLHLLPMSGQFERLR